MHALPRLLDAGVKARLAHLGLGQVQKLGQVAVGEAVALGAGKLVGGQHLRGMLGGPGDDTLLGIDELLHLLDEVGLDLGELVQLLDRGALAQRLVHLELAIGRGEVEQREQFVEGLLVVVLHEAQAIDVLLERADGLLEGLLVGLADGHDLAHGAHLRAQVVRDALELLEGPARELDDDVIAVRIVLVERAVLAAGDLVERQATREHGRDQRDGKARGLGGQCRRTRGARIDLDDDVAVAHRVMRPLHVGAADDADLVDDRVGLLLQAVDDLLRNGLHGGGAERIARMHAHRVDVLDGADGDELSLGIADDLELELLPAQDALLDQDLGDRGRGQAAGDRGLELVDVVDQATAGAAHGVGGAQHTRVAELLGDLDGFLDRVRDAAAGHLDAELGHRVLELLAILAALDGIDLDADDLDAVLVEDARLGKLARKVEAGLAAQVGKQRVGTFERDDLLEALDVEGLDVGAIGDVGVGHDGGRVGVDEDDLVAQRTERLACLRARIIELARLADDDGAGSDDHYLVDIGALGHGVRLSARAYNLRYDTAPSGGRIAQFADAACASGDGMSARGDETVAQGRCLIRHRMRQRP